MQKLTLNAARFIVGFAALFSLFAAADVAFAQYAGPYGQVVVTTQTAQTAGGTILPSASSVTVSASNASLSGAPTLGETSASFNANFNNDTHIVTFTPGSYSVLATQVPGYWFAYSSGCNGFIPAGGSSAQCTVTAYQGTNGGGTYNNATLIVYTNIVNSNNSYYNYPPQSLNITVLGNNPSPATFTGNSGGTVVNLGVGNYSVLPANMGGWSVTQSPACSGVIQNNETRYCTITYSYSGGFPYYPYNPGNTTLSCSPAYQQASLGATVLLTADGGMGTYSWNTGERTYINAGPTITTNFQNSGTHIVTVTSGTQSATCAVYALYPYGATIGQPANGGLSSLLPFIDPPAGNGYPALPNTGFAPQDGAGIAFAFVALIAAGILTAPYVRKQLHAIRG